MNSAALVDDLAFWNAVRFIVLCPYGAHERHIAMKSPGRSKEKTRTVRIDCPSWIPTEQLVTAAHFTWPHAVFRVGIDSDDLMADPEDFNKNWEDENYRDLYVFTMLGEDGQCPVPLRENRPPQLDKRMPTGFEQHHPQKLHTFYFSAIFHITKTGDIRPLRCGDGLPGIELVRMKPKKKRRLLISAAFIAKWLSSYDSNNYS